MTDIAHLRLDRLSKQYAGQTVVDAVTLEVRQGEMVVLLGPSGCGKTTILRMIAGFTPATAAIFPRWQQHPRQTGASARHGHRVPELCAVSAHECREEHFFRLEMRRQSSKEISSRVQEMLQLVKLENLAQRLPRQLSAVSSNAWHWHARWRSVRTCCCSTNRSPTSTPPCARRSRATSAILQREGGLTRSW